MVILLAQALEVIRRNQILHVHLLRQRAGSDSDFTLFFTIAGYFRVRHQAAEIQTLRRTILLCVFDQDDQSLFLLDLGLHLLEHHLGRTGLRWWVYCCLIILLLRRKLILSALLLLLLVLNEQSRLILLCVLSAGVDLATDLIVQARCEVI